MNLFTKRYLAVLIGLFCSLMAEPTSPVGRIMEEKTIFGSNYTRKFTYYRTDGQAITFWAETHTSGHDSTYTSYDYAPYEFKITGDATAEFSGPRPSKLYYSGSNWGSFDYPYFAFHTFYIWPTQADSGLLNCSNRGYIAPEATLTSGFVLADYCYVLIRAVGPSLRSFGVTNAAKETSFTLYRLDEKLGSSSVWSSDPKLVSGYKGMFDYVGAFPLQPGSSDSILFIMLRPGTYTVQSSAGTLGGEVLTEIYMMK